MQKQQLVEFAKRLGLKKIDATKRSGWVIARCPFARWRHEKGTDTTPSFGLKVNKQFCHCFSCDWSSDLEEMLIRLAVFAKGSAEAGKRIRTARDYLLTEGRSLLILGKDEDEEEADEIIEWPEWVIGSYLPAPTHPYLAERKGGPVPIQVAKMMDFRLDPKRQRLGVPVRDFDGRLMGFHGRTINNHEIKYLAYKYANHWNKPIWLGEHWVDFSKPVLIAESVFDLARCLQVYRNTITPLMASLPKSKITRIGEAMRIVLLFDDDKAGKLAADKIKAGLPDTSFIVPGLPAGYNDPGDMPVEILASRLSPYLDLDPVITA